jgi:hypothetical protein
VEKSLSSHFMKRREKPFNAYWPPQKVTGGRVSRLDADKHQKSRHDGR